MKVFTTQYKIINRVGPEEEAQYSSQFFAQNFSHAKDVIKKRNIGEFDLGTTGKFDLFDRTILDDLKSDKLMHLVVHSLWIFGNMYSARDVLTTMEDQGMVHELIHYKNGDKCVIGKKEIIRQLKRLLNEVFNLPKSFWNHTVNEFDK